MAPPPVTVAMDGHPMDCHRYGETYVYEFEALNRADLHIYNPHSTRHGAASFNEEALKELPGRRL